MHACSQPFLRCPPLQASLRPVGRLRRCFAGAQALRTWLWGWEALCTRLCVCGGVTCRQGFAQYFLQGEVGSPRHRITANSVTNAAMASAPGHPLWIRVIELIQERADQSDLTIIELTGKPHAPCCSARTALPSSCWLHAAHVAFTFTPDERSQHQTCLHAVATAAMQVLGSSGMPLTSSSMCRCPSCPLGEQYTHKSRALAPTAGTAPASGCTPLANGTAPALSSMTRKSATCSIRSSSGKVSCHEPWII